MVWKSVVGYEGYYEVSDRGDVRSVDRTIIRNDGVLQVRTGRLKSQREDDYGYLVVKLSKDGVDRLVRVHRLVAEAFIGICHGYGHEVNHIDFNRKNNYADNLEWVTHLENVRHTINARRHVTCKDMSGCKNPNYGNRKLSDFYSQNPEAAKVKQSRPGKRNGRARGVRVIIDGDTYEFDYMKQCAEFLVESGFSKSSTPEGMIPYISKAATNSKKYLGFMFEFI